MQGVRWSAGAFGITLAVMVGLRADGEALAFGTGLLIGMVAMLPLTAGLLVTLAAYRPRSGVVEGRCRRARPAARSLGGWAHRRLALVGLDANERTAAELRGTR